MTPATSAWCAPRAIAGPRVFTNGTAAIRSRIGRTTLRGCHCTTGLDRAKRGRGLGPLAAPSKTALAAWYKRRLSPRTTRRCHGRSFQNPASAPPAAAPREPGAFVGPAAAAALAWISLAIVQSAVDLAKLGAARGLHVVLGAAELALAGALSAGAALAYARAWRRARRPLVDVLTCARPRRGRARGRGRAGRRAVPPRGRVGHRGHERRRSRARRRRRRPLGPGRRDRRGRARCGAPAGAGRARRGRRRRKQPRARAVPISDCTSSPRGSRRCSSARRSAACRRGASRPSGAQAGPRSR